MKNNLKKIAILFTTYVVIFATTPLSANEIKEVVTAQAPKAIGPYSQAVQAGQTLYISGQIGVDPVTGNFAGESIEAQTKQVLKNIAAILSVHGLTAENVIKSDVFLKDIGHFAAMNVVYGEYFATGVKPARCTIQAAKLPKDALVEISCVAYVPSK